jgi:hypothetical protein
MNDNIEKLCAELLHYDDMIFGWRETVERAAEAIVLECARVVKASSPQGMIGVNAIRIHFGVEP